MPRQHFWVQYECFLRVYLQVFTPTSPVKEVICKLVLLASSIYKLYTSKYLFWCIFGQNCRIPCAITLCSCLPPLTFWPLTPISCICQLMSRRSPPGYSGMAGACNSVSHVSRAWLASGFSFSFFRPSVPGLCREFLVLNTRQEGREIGTGLFNYRPTYTQVKTKRPGKEITFSNSTMTKWWLCEFKKKICENISRIY